MNIDCKLLIVFECVFPGKTEKVIISFECFCKFTRILCVLLILFVIEKVITFKYGVRFSHIFKFEIESNKKFPHIFVHNGFWKNLDLESNE